MITAKIIADSVSPVGKRITTFELEFPRFILAEFNTHRMLSRNSASSRAIPINKVIEGIQQNPAMPVWWGKNQPGMQAKEELDDTDSKLYVPGFSATREGIFYDKKTWTDREYAKCLWLDARDSAISYAKRLSDLGLHKQIVNRILEPWVTTKVVATATDWDNFFFLRNHEDAQPEIHVLAEIMVDLYYKNTPQLLNYGEWHLPYVDYQDGLYFSGGELISLEDGKKVSASLCAQTSYRKSDESVSKACNVYERLVGSSPKHSSPFEHQATPLEDSNAVSGNLRGWRQLRKDISEETCVNYLEKSFAAVEINS